MYRKHAVILFLLLAVTASRPAQAQAPGASAADEPLGVLAPSVAGAFYPGDAETLRADISRYLEAAKLPEIEGEIVAAIVPHAGYVYSGPVAAYAYKAIGEQERERGAGDRKLDAVVVLAFSHRKPYRYVSVYHGGSLETPLGRAAVSESVAKTFMDSDPRLAFNREVFLGEHSAEVQIPFLQTVLPGTPIVPAIFGRQGLTNVEAVVKGLEQVAGDRRILVVATTDLSHYNPYETANTLDAETVNMILKGDPLKMARYAGEKRNSMCGSAPVLAALAYAQSRGAKPVLLKYANSGDTAGKKDAVVGYVSIIFVKEEQSNPGEKAAPPESASGTDEKPEKYMTDRDKRVLLELARKSVESIVRDKKLIEVDEPESKRLTANGAAFVTLRKGGNLRGCIGRMDASAPLYEVIIRMAAAAATEDNRFAPVRPDELSDITIEISVNTPLRPVSGPDEIVLGEHGVVVSKGFRRGVFLPHVAEETGWTKEQFLRNLCAHKAGLAPDAYKNGAQLHVFNSIVFEEGK